ncbi:SDR family oxidoreductase [Streptomyces sp. NPDC005799]|uniref:SDR family NAD(P)-dependent oxidoreductase n=1 Tax=Streptomyces sp. NPDC005799 TaxID=3154678 RepID=UPI00340F0642
MPKSGEHVVVIGGTRGLGLSIAEACTELGAAVTVTGRELATAQSVASTLPNAIGRSCDLNDSDSIADLFADIAEIDHLILVALDRDGNTIADFRPKDSARTALMKNVGYATAVHHAIPHFSQNASVVLFSGMSMWRPVPGSTTISMANAGVIGLMRSLAVEIAPVRVNAITPGVVAGTAAVDDVDDDRRKLFEALRQRTPGKRLPTPADVVAATFALTDNPGINGENLAIDAGMRLV